MDAPPPHYDPGREDKDFSFSGGLDRVKPKTPQDKAAGCWEGDMINRTWLNPGWDSGAHSSPVPKRFDHAGGGIPLSDRSASSRKSEEVITDEPHAGKLARVVLAGLSFGI